MEQALQSHQQFFDRVLGEYEAGHAGNAVLMLSGMLDAALGRGERLGELRRTFAAHPLGAMCSLATKSDNGLGDSVARLGFARGLAARRELGAQAIERAWQAGKQVLLLDCGERGELVRLKGRELENISAEHSQPDQHATLVSRYGLAAADPEHRFDLIVATAWPDGCSPEELAARITRATTRLSPDGRLLLSAFVPGHLGWGWQAVCMGRELHCHDEASLAAAAAQAGLAINQFRDGSGSLIWAELHKNGAASPARGKP